MPSKRAMAMDTPPERAVGRLDPFWGVSGLVSLLLVIAHGLQGFADPPWTHLQARVAGLGQGAFAFLVVLGSFALAQTWQRPPYAARAGARLGSLVWRFYPAYALALIVTLGILSLVPALTSEQMAQTMLSETARAYSPGSLLSHVVALANWFPRWQARVNPALSELSAAGQAGGLLAVLVWPVWRRHGLRAALGLGALLGFAPLLVAHERASAAWTPCFAWAAFGLAPAALASAAEPHTTWLGKQPWLAIACGLWASFSAVQVALGASALSMVVAGCASTALLLGLVQRAASAEGLRVPGGLWALIGRRALSLYLVHVPALALSYLALRRLHAGPGVQPLLLLALGVPLSCAFAFGFWAVVERRFCGAPPPLWAVLRVTGRVAAAFSSALALVLAWEFGLERFELPELKAQQTFAQVGGRAVRYRLDHAQAPGPLVVFGSSVHSLEEWTRVASFVARFAPTLVYDRCGMGLSDPFVGECTPEASADELRGLLDALGRRTIILVGYSISSVGTRAFLARYPERLAGVLIVDPFMPETGEANAAGSAETRTYFRVMLPIDIAKASVGMLRLTTFLAAPDARDELARRVQIRTRHAYHVFRQARQFSGASAAQFVRERAADVPVIMLSGAPPAGEIGQIQRAYVAQLKHAEWRPITGLRHELLVRFAEPDGPLVKTLAELVSLQRKVVDSDSAP